MSLGCFITGGILANLGPLFFFGLAISGVHSFWALNNFDISNKKKLWRIFETSKYIYIILALSVLFGKIRVKQVDEV
jgi:hypothetical protein